MDKQYSLLSNSHANKLTKDIALSHPNLTYSISCSLTSSLMAYQAPIPNPLHSLDFLLTNYFLTHIHSQFHSSNQVLLQFR